MVFPFVLPAQVRPAQAELRCFAIRAGLPPRLDRGGEHHRRSKLRMPVAALRGDTIFSPLRAEESRVARENWLSSAAMARERPS
jgi:hypothetical protein